MVARQSCGISIKDDWLGRIFKALGILQKIVAYMTPPKD